MPPYGGSQRDGPQAVVAWALDCVLRDLGFQAVQRRDDCGTEAGAYFAHSWKRLRSLKPDFVGTVSDVSAILLSLGEPSLPKVRNALDQQTYGLSEVVTVEQVHPFHRAFAAGVARVRTPFFVQVDADMVLDPHCVEALRGSVEDDVGIVCGNLRDPLMGQVEGVKLFRTEVARLIPQADTVSSETDFVDALERRGWRLKYIGRLPDDGNQPHRTYGDHVPDYTASYTFQKYLLEGRKYRYRGARSGLGWKMRELGQSRHEMAPFARIALAHGFFLDQDRDAHVPTRQDVRAEVLARLLDARAELPASLDRLFPLDRHGSLRAVFHAFVSSGAAMASAAAGGSVHETLRRLAEERRGWPAAVAELGFGHGILEPRTDRAHRDAARRKLRAFVYLGVGRRLSLGRWLRAHLERWYYQLPQAEVPRREMPWWRMVPRW